jgi:hypothetical protein
MYINVIFYGLYYLLLQLFVPMYNVLKLYEH